MSEKTPRIRPHETERPIWHDAGMTALANLGAGMYHVNPYVKQYAGKLAMRRPDEPANPTL